MELAANGRVLKLGGCVRQHELDKIVGKLNHFCKVVQGGRLHLQPLWDSKAALEVAVGPGVPAGAVRSVTSAGARACPSYRPKLILPLSVEAKAGLLWWRDRLTMGEVPWRPLFVKPDGYLDIFDGATFKCPWNIPIAHRGTSKLVVITYDASASGFGFVVGVPQRPAFKYAGSFSPEQSSCTSNWRECWTGPFSLRVLAKRSPDLLMDAFVVFRSDNTSAVSLVNKGSSRSKPLREIGRALFDLASTYRMQLAAMHIPGRLNTVADKLSREAEELYASRRVTEVAVVWLRKVIADQGLCLYHMTDVLCPGGAPLLASNRLHPPLHSLGKGPVACSIPPPATMEACIRATGRVRSLGYYAALVLPFSKEAVYFNRWFPLLQRHGFHHVSPTPKNMVLFDYTQRQCPDASYDSPPLELNVKPRLHLWLSRAPEHYDTAM